MRKSEDLFLDFWVVRVREFRVKMSLSQEILAEKLRVNVRNYQKLEWGVHKPSAITLLLFLNLLPDQEVLAFVHTFGKLANTGQSEGSHDHGPPGRFWLLDEEKLYVRRRPPLRRVWVRDQPAKNLPPPFFGAAV